MNTLVVRKPILGMMDVGRDQRMCHCWVRRSPYYGPNETQQHSHMSWKVTEEMHQVQKLELFRTIKEAQLFEVS